MADNATVHVEDLHAVRSRINWGAIVAGSAPTFRLFAAPAGRAAHPNRDRIGVA